MIPEVGQFALIMALLLALAQATIPMIDLGVLLLLANPEQHRALLADPSLLPTALEEVLRIAPHSEAWAPRYAKTDLDVAGVAIQAGWVAGDSEVSISSEVSGRPLITGR